MSTLRVNVKQVNKVATDAGPVVVIKIAVFCTPSCCEFQKSFYHTRMLRPWLHRRVRLSRPEEPTQQTVLWFRFLCKYVANWKMLSFDVFEVVLEKNNNISKIKIKYTIWLVVLQFIVSIITHNVKLSITSSLLWVLSALSVQRLHKAKLYGC